MNCLLRMDFTDSSTKVNLHKRDWIKTGGNDKSPIPPAFLVWYENKQGKYLT